MPKKSKQRVPFTAVLLAIFVGGMLVFTLLLPAPAPIPVTVTVEPVSSELLCNEVPPEEDFQAIVYVRTQEGRALYSTYSGHEKTPEHRSWEVILPPGEYLVSVQTRSPFVAELSAGDGSFVLTCDGATSYFYVTVDDTEAVSPAFVVHRE